MYIFPIRTNGPGFDNSQDMNLILEVKKIVFELTTNGILCIPLRVTVFEHYERSFKVLKDLFFSLSYNVSLRRSVQFHGHKLYTSLVPYHLPILRQRESLAARACLHF